MMKTLFFLMPLSLIGLAGTGSAQDVQIQLDTEGKIEYIDAKLERELGLFTEYSNFREARLFQLPDTSFVLEISYRSQEKLLRVRLPFAAPEVENLQRKVTARLQQRKPQIGLDQSGRKKFLYGTFGLSYGYYGWAVPAMLDVDEGKSTVALYMLTSSAGFYLPLSLTKKISVTDAAATLSIYGGSRGIGHGLALAYLLSEDPPARAMLAAGVLVSVAETFAGFRIASRSKMSAGTAETIGTGGDFGIGLGVAAAILTNGFGERDQAMAGSVLLGAGAGLWSGKLLADHQPFTAGDAHIFRGLGLLGAYVPLAVVDITGTDNVKAYTAASTLGALAGLGLGNKLVQGKDFTTDQGKFTLLSELAGGMLGLGLAYLISDDNTTLYLASSAIGAASGFWFMYRSYAPSARTANKYSSLNIALKPEALLALAMDGVISPAQALPLPLLSLTYRF